MHDVNSPKGPDDIASGIGDLAARSLAVETLLSCLLAQANEGDPRLIPHLTTTVVDGVMARPTDNEVLKATRVYMRQMLAAAVAPQAAHRSSLADHFLASHQAAAERGDGK